MYLERVGEKQERELLKGSWSPPVTARAPAGRVGGHEGKLGGSLIGRGTAMGLTLQVASFLSGYRFYPVLDPQVESCSW